MKKLLVATALIAGLATASASAADLKMITKAPPPPPPSPFDVVFGTAFTTDYELRGISQTNHKPAVQGYFEGDYKATDWLTVYAGLWGSNVSFADAEFDISGGGRFSWGNFGLDVGFVYYAYPAGGGIDYGEAYAKPSYKFNDWLSVGATVIGGNNFGNLGQSAWYYAGNATVTLPQFTPIGITTTISGEVGRQTYDSTLNSALFGFVDYTTWNVGVAFNYKAITLDLRYWDTDISSTSAPVQCFATTGTDLCDGRFVATLKFDTSLSALK